MLKSIFEVFLVLGTLVAAYHPHPRREPRAVTHLVLGATLTAVGRRGVPDNVTQSLTSSYAVTATRKSASATVVDPATVSDRGWPRLVIRR